MSVAAISWALKQSVPRTTHKFVLVVLANYADADNCCYPSVECLCQNTGQNRKTILDGLKFLRDHGLIVDTSQRVGRTGNVIVYKLLGGENLTVPKTGLLEGQTVPETGQFETVPKTDGNSPVFSSNSPKNGRKQSQKRDTDTKGTLKSTRKKTLKEIDGVNGVPHLPKELSTPMTEKAWSEFVAHRQQIKKPMTPLAAEKIFGKLAEWKEHKWVQAVDDAIERRWAGIFEPKVLKPNPDVYRPPKCF